MADYPRPLGSVAMLAPLNAAPGGPDVAPGCPSAEVLWSDQSWRPVRALAWRRLPGGWAVLVRWPDRSQTWSEHDERYLRPDRGAFTAEEPGPA